MQCQRSRVCRPSKSLRLLLSAALLLSPMASLRAHAQAIGKSYITQETVVAGRLQPKQILSPPAHELVPVEIAKAVGQKYLGIDLAHLTKVTVAVEPPLGTNLFYSAFFEADQPWKLDQLAPELTQHTQPGEIRGRACLLSQQPMAPSFMQLKDNLIVIGSQGMLEKLASGNSKPTDSVIASLVATEPPTDDLYVAVDLEGLRPLISLGLMQAAQQFPAKYQRFLQIPNLLESAELKLNLRAAHPSSLYIHCGSESNAGQVEGLLQDAVELAKVQMSSEMEQQLSAMRSSDDPIQQATAAYADRALGVYLNMFVPQRRGGSFVLFDTADGGNDQMAWVAVVGVLVALLLPAVQAARAAARRNVGINNLRQLVLAQLNYEAAKNSLPAHALYSDDGKPLLSWRVLLLPYMGHQELYRQFDLDEPWNSPHNKQLIPLMPEVFASPTSTLDRSLGKTNYVVPIGAGFVFDGTIKGSPLRSITDGTSNTICMLEVNDDVAPVWTQPSDLEVAPDTPLVGLGGQHAGVFLAAFCDGHVTSIAPTIDAQVFLSLLTKSGGESTRLE